MRYIWLHIKTITETYSGEVPLAHFLKAYFKQHPILGSRDRKLLSAMTYSWYRCAKGIPAVDFETKVRKSILLCNNELPKSLATTDTVGMDLAATRFDSDAIFPFDIEFSAGTDKAEWVASMPVQPNLFIRVLKDKGKTISLLNAANIPFTFVTDNCLSLPNGAKIDTILPPDTYVVQDASSQQTGDYFKPAKNEVWYDCCAGAGGKSLLLKSLEPSVWMTVSDLRESILYNLKQRFSQYHYHAPVAHTTDVANKVLLDRALGSKQFDNIICDAPCSGSGTWARTPEQLYFFDPATIETFAALQKQIAINVSRYLKTGGRLIYITCSVFKNENEDVVSEVVKQTGLQLTEAKLINGINIHADIMYVAVLKKV